MPPTEPTPAGKPDARRKSGRARKVKSLKNDLPPEVLSATGMGQEGKMPPGWNPSDDSEDDYNPAKEKAAKKGRKRDKDDDSEEEDRPRKSRVTPGRRPKGPVSAPSKASPAPMMAKVKAEPEASDSCVLCGERLRRTAAGNTSDLRFHYARHYFQAGSFSKIAVADPADMLPGKLLPGDLTGLVYKYKCTLQPCTQRQLGYRELAMHLATQHQKLKEVMAVDPRPGVAGVLALLYPDQPEKPAPGQVRVKQEKDLVMKKSVVTASSPAIEMDNSEDEDDPTVSPPAATVPVTISAKLAAMVKKELPTGPVIHKVHSCLVCDTKEGRNLSHGSALTEHYAVCFYNHGKFVGIVDPGPANMDQKGKPKDEYGVKYRYRCSVPGCTARCQAKAVGFKEFAIHSGREHHMVEKVMAVEQAHYPGLAEVLAAVKETRARDGKELEDLPPVLEEEVHKCLLCNGIDRKTGKDDREAKELSLAKGKVQQARYHYAGCYYDSGVYLKLYPPGEANTDKDGKAIDIMGKDFHYSCTEPHCTNKRKMGYKEFSIHNSVEHNGLERVMREDERKEIRDLAVKFL
jgi:hypothetical protein